MLEAPQTKGPDLAKGITINQLVDGVGVEGHFQGEPVLAVRRGDEVLVVGARCTHYGAPLVEGLVVGESVRCPWHHACFSLRSGEVLKAPALNALDCYTVERTADRIRVTGKRGPAPARTSRTQPASIVIVGAGAAGSAAAETLRQEGYAGTVTLVGEDPEIPYDRPNLSKDYLAGTAPEEWIPLRSREFYREKRITLRTGTRVASIDVKARNVVLENGDKLSFGTLLLATGAQARRLPIPGADLPHVLTLRNLADSRALIARAKTAKHAVVIGAGFIGLEVAASLRTRGLDVHIVAPDARPLERILGAELADMIRAIHESHGVVFHLGKKPAAIQETEVVLSDGKVLPADLVVIGAGVVPETGLATQAGLTTDAGVKVNEYLQTGDPQIFAAGDIARWPDSHAGAPIRVEHWAVAQRQGQTAARNMLGAAERFTAVPYFWSAHFDVTISYVGHAESWDRLVIDGDAQAHDCRVEYWQENRRLAVATVNRDRASLQAEAEMEAIEQKKGA
jgi:NADPH-dependent 2,4-dienoyl-CoA reductase/sulfur reductase-like enzyme/nitrite reductase/ring-hydroxylating ferredoxin subunit